jgi:hypothetical protein
MSHSNRKTQEAETLQDIIVISSATQELEVPVKKSVKICWNTGEEKNCLACYLSKGCKAKA